MTESAVQPEQIVEAPKVETQPTDNNILSKLTELLNGGKKEPEKAEPKPQEPTIDIDKIKKEVEEKAHQQLLKKLGFDNVDVAQKAKEAYEASLSEDEKKQIEYQNLIEKCNTLEAQVQDIEFYKAFVSDTGVDADVLKAMARTIADKKQIPFQEAIIEAKAMLNLNKQAEPSKTYDIKQTTSGTGEIVNPYETGDITAQMALYNKDPQLALKLNDIAMNKKLENITTKRI